MISTASGETIGLWARTWVAANREVRAMAKIGSFVFILGFPPGSALVLLLELGSTPFRLK